MTKHCAFMSSYFAKRFSITQKDKFRIFLESHYFTMIFFALTGTENIIVP